MKKEEEEKKEGEEEDGKRRMTSIIRINNGHNRMKMNKTVVYLSCVFQRNTRILHKANMMELY